MYFQYYEVRPCIEVGGEVTSYDSEDEYAQALEGKSGYKTFWTLYGIYHTGESRSAELGWQSHAIADFKTKEAAHEIMNAILAPIADARDILVERYSPRTVWAMLDDIINQSSNEERI